MASAEPSATWRGRVVALEANFCRVALDEPGPGGGRHLLCTRRSRLGKCGLQICVGDRVRVEGIDWAAGRGAVGALDPRSSLLPRPAVANVARVVVVTALREPDLDPLQLTRFLVTAEGSAPAVEVVLTKADLLPPVAVAAWLERIRSWGYAPRAVSLPSGEGLEDVLRLLAGGGLAVLCGPSGVGKSSLLNALMPGLELRVGAVSGRLRRGRHTTRHVELFPLAEGAYVADTPGFNRPALPRDGMALARAFPELRGRLEQAGCRFRNCRHLGDPGCAAGTDWDRFPLYRRCLEEIDSDIPTQGSAVLPPGETGVRLRGGRAEPRLDPRLRSRSRRRRRQSLEGELSPPDPADSDPDRR